MKILAIGAHLDDIEMGCGGTIAFAAAAGCVVQSVTMTDSGYADLDGIVQRTSKQAFAEAKAATQILGIDEPLVLNYPNKDVPYTSEVVEAIERIIREFGPDIIFTHWEHDTHISHQNTALATFAAARNCYSVLAYEPPVGRLGGGFTPQVYISVSDFIDKKMRAIGAHATEVEKYGANWTQAIIARAQFHGYNVGVKYAEAFAVKRLLLGGGLWQLGVQ